jgi:hypothetical protein
LGANKQASSNYWRDDRRELRYKFLDSFGIVSWRQDFERKPPTSE